MYSKIRTLLSNPPWHWPFLLLARLTAPTPPAIWIVNTIFQRIFRVNAHVPFMVHFTSIVIGNVTIGRHVEHSFACSGGCYIQGINGVSIGDDTLFAPGVKMISANHDMDSEGRHLPAPPIRIGKRCWIGANAVILPGVELGDDVIVGAGAVVTKSCPAGVIVAGVPARQIGTRTQQEEPDTHGHAA